ncbi:MAG: hypothetical protein Q4A90_05375 [Streptococcus sp.]|nr:hypothetical protein [Streptococcus sp.]
MKPQTQIKTHKKKKRWMSVTLISGLLLSAYVGSNLTLAEESTTNTNYPEKEKGQTESSYSQNSQTNENTSSSNFEDKESSSISSSSTNQDSSTTSNNSNSETQTSQSDNSTPSNKNSNSTPKSEDDTKSTQKSEQSSSNAVTNDEQKQSSEEKKQGFTTDKNGSWYFYNNGEKATGWQTINGKTLYFNKDGKQIKGELVLVDNQLHFFDSNSGELVKNDFRYINNSNNYKYTPYFNGWMYFDSEGKPVTGWKTINGKTFYFAEQKLDGDNFHQIGGQIKGEVYEINGKKYYFDPLTGELVTNRFIYFKGMFYRVNNQGIVTDIGPDSKQLESENIKNSFYYGPDKSWYYFDKNGQKVTGWQTIGSKTYFFDQDGKQVKGRFISLDGKQYYLMNSTGEIARKTIETIDDKQYYFNQEGQILKNATVNYQGYSYSLNKSGIATEIVQRDTFTYDEYGNCYYFDEKGHKVTGFQKIDGMTLYFDTSFEDFYGAQVKGDFVSINGDSYYFDQKTGQMYANETVVIDGVEYYFDENGRAR